MLKLQPVENLFPNTQAAHISCLLIGMNHRMTFIPSNSIGLEFDEKLQSQDLLKGNYVCSLICSSICNCDGPFWQYINNYCL